MNERHGELEETKHALGACEAREQSALNNLSRVSAELSQAQDAVAELKTTVEEIRAETDRRIEQCVILSVSMRGFDTKALATVEFISQIHDSRLIFRSAAATR